MSHNNNSVTIEADLASFEASPTRSVVELREPLIQ